MRRLSRRYDVRVIRPDGASRPRIWGYEEINVNGRKRTRYWDENSLPRPNTWLDEGLWDALEINIPVLSWQLTQLPNHPTTQP